MEKVLLRQNAHKRFLDSGKNQKKIILLRNILETITINLYKLYNNWVKKLKTISSLKFVTIYNNLRWHSCFEIFEKTK